MSVDFEMTGDKDCEGCLCYKEPSNCVFLMELAEYRHLCPCGECLVKMKCRMNCQERIKIRRICQDIESFNY